VESCIGVRPDKEGLKMLRLLLLRRSDMECMINDAVSSATQLVMLISWTAIA
jgi:hypothetical protein